MWIVIRGGVLLILLMMGIGFKLGISGLLHHVVTTDSRQNTRLIDNELLKYMVSHDNDASESSQPSCEKACILELSVQLPGEYSASVRRIVADFLHVPPNGYSSKPNDMKQLHGLLDSIISDMDKVFISYFWQSLFKVLEVQLKLSVHTIHKQMAKQSCVWPNGQILPIHTPYVAGESIVEAVHRTLQTREQALNMLKFCLKRAQDRMRNLANKNRSDRVFEVGMWVYLNLQPHRQVTIRQGQQNKLSSKYFRPFMIIKKVGVVAYKLELPSTSQVHHVFHVSQLKLCKGSSNKMGILPHRGPNGLLSVEPVAILDKRMKKVNNRVAVYVLVKWSNHTDEDSNHTDEDATWELYSDLIQRFSDFKEKS
ncbi:hypothetical protein Tco_0807199 [Tanacetum coccineum]